MRCPTWLSVEWETTRGDAVRLRGPPGGTPDAVHRGREGLRIALWEPGGGGPVRRSARRVVGRTLKEVFPAETSLARHLSDTLTTGESRSEAEALVETPDGRSMHVSIVTAPLAGKSGAVTAAVAVVRDITRLYQLEAEMRRGETLAAAGQIAMGLAHEIRNPLGASAARPALKRERADGRRGEYTRLLKEATGQPDHRVCSISAAGAASVQLNINSYRARRADVERAPRGGVTIVRRTDPSMPPSERMRTASSVFHTW